MSKIRLGFVGVGGMGQCAHLVNYASLAEAGECEVAAISELRPELAKKVAGRYGIPRVYADYRDMLAKETLDGIVHINRFGFHGQMVPELAKAGKPLLTEKPLANSVETGDKIVAAVRGTGAKHYLAYHKRSDPAVMYAKELMAKWAGSGEFGKLKYVRIVMPPGDWIASGFNGLLKTDEPGPEPAKDPRPATMTETEFAYYHYLVNYYIHQINLLRHFVGDYEVTFAEPSGVLLAARNAEGVAATIEMGTFATSLAWQESVFVAFERGWIQVELPAPLSVHRAGKVTVYRDAKNGVPEKVEPEMPWVHAMRQQAVHFLQAVRGEATPLATMEDGLKDLKSMRQYMGLFAAAGGVVKSPW